MVQNKSLKTKGEDSSKTEPKVNGNAEHTKVGKGRGRKRALDTSSEIKSKKPKGMLNCK